MTQQNAARNVLDKNYYSHLRIQAAITSGIQTQRASQEFPRYMYESAPDLPILGQDRVHGVQHAFATLDIVNLAELFAELHEVGSCWLLQG